MNARDLFLVQHSGVHSKAVGGNPVSAADRTFSGLTDEQMRVRPREDLNSLAWIMWHIARAEDILGNMVIAERDQVWGEAWRRRLKVERPDFGIGMSSAEVSELTQQIDIAALREYRDAVGLRTREIVSAFGDAEWSGETTVSAMERAAATGAFGKRAEQMVKAFSGRPRVAVLTGIALLHPAGHMGEAGTVRTAGGFGTGI